MWEEIQDAQDAVALRALWELMRDLTQNYQLRPALRSALRAPGFLVSTLFLSTFWWIATESVHVISLK